MSLKRLEEIIVGQDMYGHVIGVHYRGSGSYQTKLGAFVTLATYVLMVINMVTLFIAFKDGSNQGEKFQSEKIDRFYNEPVNFAENDFRIAMFVIPQIPAEVASFKAAQCVENECLTYLDMGTCSTEHLSDNRDYWVPRIGETAFSEVERDIQCINDTDMQIKGEDAIPSSFENIGIAMLACDEVDDPTIECMSKEDRDAYWETV